MNDCWDQAALRRLLEAAKTGICDPECPECHPVKRPPVRAFNTTKATAALAALLAIIILLGVLFA